MKYITTAFLALTMISLVACSDDDPVDPQPQEFVAADADFASYGSWAQTITPQKGVDPAGLVGGAHNAGDTSMTRHIFINDNSVSKNASGNYPVGTRLVKEVRMGDGSVAVVTAMVKRGGTFNENNRNWEWFILNSDGKIQSRGGDLLNNMCNGCHAQAADKDYVFTK